MGFSRQEYLSGLPFPPPVEHVFSTFHYDPSTLGGPARHSITELRRPLHYHKAMIHEREKI